MEKSRAATTDQDCCTALREEIALILLSADQSQLRVVLQFIRPLKK